MTGAGLCKPFRSKERHTWCIPVKRQQLSLYASNTAETTIGHTLHLLSSSRWYTANILPVNVILSRLDSGKDGKVFRAATVFLSVLQKWSCAFHTSIKLAAVSKTTGLPGVAFKIKVLVRNVCCNVLNVTRCRRSEFVGNESAFLKIGYLMEMSNFQVSTLQN